MKPSSFLLGVAISWIIGSSPGAAMAQHAHSPYAGEEGREIKTLSPEDIQQLKEGRGWGLAKAAELNGVPGPIHLLELKEEIGLTPAQTQEIETIYGEMKNKAMALGSRLIELERELNKAFARGKIDEARLKRMLSDISDVRGRLRYVHLSAHLKTPFILTGDQIRNYNKLRGYAASGSAQGATHRHDAMHGKKKHP